MTDILELGKENPQELAELKDILRPICTDADVLGMFIKLKEEKAKEVKE